MPEEGETRTNEKTGLEEVYFLGKWVSINGKREKSASDNSPKVDCEIVIGKLTLKATAKPKTFEKSGRKGYRIDLKPGQNFWGSGNFLMKSK